jgi:microcystin-dependent protein
MSLADDCISAAPGSITDFAGISLPAGYLWAAGQAVSRTAYARLFAALSVSFTGNVTSGSVAISAVSQDLTALGPSLVGSPISGPGIPAGATISAVTSATITLSANANASGTAVALVAAPHGIGDGSTTFNVPDARGRVSVGRDDMNGTAASRMTSGGSGVNGVLLGAAGGVETVTLTASQIPAHTHPYGFNGAGTGAGSNAQLYQGTNTGSAGNVPANTGGGGAHSNTQPTLVLHKIIKT